MANRKFAPEDEWVEVKRIGWLVPGNNSLVAFEFGVEYIVAMEKHVFFFFKDIST